MSIISRLKRSFLPQFMISYTFIVSGMIVNILQLLTCIFVWPFDKLLYRKLNNYLIYLIWANLTSFGQYWSGTELEVYVSKEDLEMLGKENVLCVLNHKYDVDWLMGWILCARINLLGGCKVVMKNAIRHIPIFGWACAFNEYIFVKRIWETDKNSLVRDLSWISEYPKDMNFVIAIFCEGTRYTQEKYEASVEVTKAKGMPVLKHHLLPRTKGFNLVASQLVGKVDAVIYDFNLAIKDIDGRKPSLIDIKNGLPLQPQIYLRRIPLSTVPVHDEKLCSEYVFKLYQEKDEIFEAFAQNGDFSSLGCEKHILKNNKHDLYVSIFWLILVLVPTTFYLLSVVINGTWMFKAVMVMILLFSHFGVEWMIGRSDSKNGSEFGLSASAKKKD